MSGKAVYDVAKMVRTAIFLVEAAVSCESEKEKEKEKEDIPDPISDDRNYDRYDTMKDSGTKDA